MRRHTNHRDKVDEAFDELLSDAMDEYVQKQDAFVASTAAFAAWRIDEAPATLVMTAGDGSKAEFQVTPIGTYLPEPESFAWAWANDAFPEASRLRAGRLRELTASTGYAIFETPHFRADSEDLDHLCALALRALRGLAVFKVKEDVPWVFYVVGSSPPVGQ